MKATEATALKCEVNELINGMSNEMVLIVAAKKPELDVQPFLTVMHLLSDEICKIIDNNARETKE